MADQGSATGTPELYLQTGTASGVFLEIHTQNGFQTPAASGIPGGISGPASGNNQLAPADFAYSDPTAYGTKSDGTAVTPIFNLGGTGSVGPVNPSGAGNLNLFRMKNPG